MIASIDRLRRHCAGEVPLSGRLASWMVNLLSSNSLPGLIAKYESPLNVICSDPMLDNINELRSVAAPHSIDFQIYFARKANKCLEFVERAIAAGIGVDVASETELHQSLACGASPTGIICTAAIKNESLIRRCVEHDIVMTVDNTDELAGIVDHANGRQKTASIAIRLGGFRHQQQKLPTRFGFDCERDFDLIEQWGSLPVQVVGVHFHLDGCDAAQRVTGIAESLRWLDRLRALGHSPTFIDMGGGFPMSYLDDEHQWLGFWQQLSLALQGKRVPITYRNHGLGLTCINGQLHGAANAYASYQSPIRAAWLDSILKADVNGETVAESMRRRRVQLRCEPGRSLLDGCGLTLARVEFRKQNADGDWLIGLSMNRTQCQTTCDDFLVDPILIPNEYDSGSISGSSMSGYLVGAYCTESELLSLRKMKFPNGVRRGDLIVFPNTAGYLMHFLESRSHQFPLAKNVVWKRASDREFALDKIEC